MLTSCLLFTGQSNKLGNQPPEGRDRSMKAWSVSGTDYDYSYLVFAETASEARSIGYGLDGLCEGEYMDLRSRRVKKADKHASEIVGTVADFSLDAKILRSIGWYGTEDPRYCETCGLAEFYNLPESKILYQEGESVPICVGCRGLTVKHSKSTGEPK